MTLTDRECMDGCDWLEHDYGAGGLEKARLGYDEVYHNNDIPKLSPEASRGRTITNPIPRLSEWVGGVVAQVLTYQTTLVLQPLGNSLTPSEADKLEAAMGLIMAEVNPGQALTSEAYRRYLKHSHVVYQVVPGAINDRIPFSVELPSINTVFFERFKGGRPPMVSRSYDMLVKDFLPKYTGKRGQHSGAEQQVTYNQDTKQVAWEKLSDQYKAGTTPMTGMKGFADVLHIREFYNGDECSVWATAGAWDNATTVKQEVYRSTTPFQGTPFVVIPSNPQGHDEWWEDWRPIGWPAYTRVLQINHIEAERATRSDHVQEHIIRRMSPDQKEAYDKLSKDFKPVLHGGVNFIDIPADEIIPWTRLPDNDLLERSKEKKDELERFIQSWQFPATEQVISQSNVGSAQIGMQAVHQQESQLITPHTRGMGLVAQIILCGLSGDYRDNREFYAKDTVAYGRMGAKQVKPGASIQVTADTLKKVIVFGKDANVEVQVITRSETESELEQRKNDAWNDKQRRLKSLDQVIEVFNPDVTGQYKLLAEDLIDEELGATYDNGMPMVAAARNRLLYGVDVSSLINPQGGDPMQPAGATGAQPKPVPATGGVDVSSAGGPQHAGAMA